MKIVKFLLFIALLSLIVLFYTIFNVPNPLDQQYDDLVQKMMTQNEFDSEYELFVQYPEIEIFKHQIHEIKQMNYELKKACQNPIPPKGEQNFELLNLIQKLKIIKEDVQVQMRRMIEGEELNA
ncbi:MAG: hypothetical protein AAF806_29030 [Bacteroidota bacterium]